MQLAIRFIAITCILSSFLITLAGIGLLFSTPSQIEKNNHFRNHDMLPAIQFIRSIQNSNQSLTIHEQFSAWKNQTGWGNRAAFLFLHDSAEGKKAFQPEKVPKVEFIFAIWRGNWFEYYYSWTNHFTTDDFTWKDSIGSFIGATLIATILYLIGTFFWSVKIERKISL